MACAHPIARSVRQPSGPPARRCGEVLCLLCFAQSTDEVLYVAVLHTYYDVRDRAPNRLHLPASQALSCDPGFSPAAVSLLREFL